MDSGPEKTVGRWGTVSSVIALLLAIFVIVLFLRNFTFGFVPLLIVLILFMWIIGVKLNVKRKEDQRWAMLFSSILVFTFGVLCLVALNNYVNPDKAVFANNDHHAMAVEGLHIRDTRDVRLAGNSPEAIFDDDRFLGSVTLGPSYESITPSQDTIRVIPFIKRGFSVPIYARQRDTSYFLGIRTGITRKTQPYFRDIDYNSDEVFGSGDEILLTQRGTTVSFRVVERPDSLGSDYILRFVADSEEKTVVSPFTTYLRRSYPLSAMFQDVEIPGFDLTGIVLYRTVFFDTQINRLRQQYDKLGARYRLALDADADVSTVIRTGSGYRWTPAQISNSFEFKADGLTVYAIGTEEGVAPQFRFYTKQDGGVSLRYRMPKYRYLSANYAREGKKREELSFMLATTILESDGSVNQLIPENILLFDEFDHPDNIHQMKPVFLSFVTGSTQEKLRVSLYSADGVVRSGNLAAGDPFPDLQTVGGKTDWIVSLDNFKDPNLVRPGEITRPMSSRTIALILVAVILLSVILLFVRGGQRYSYVEPLVYLVLLGFLTIRLFLLWRISVFPPVMSVSVSEFNGIFRNPSSFTGLFTGGSSLTWIIRLLIIFYAAIFCVKMWKFRLDSGVAKERPVEDEYLLKRYFLILVIGVPVLFAVAAVVGKLLHQTSRIVCVLLPLVVFFLVDFISNRLFGGVYKRLDDDEVDLRYLWVLIANSFGATLYCFVMDGGFGIVFMFFCILNIIMRLIDAFIYKGRDSDTKYISRWVYVLSILAVVFIAFSKNILLLLLDGKAFAILLFFLLAVVYLVVLLTFNIIRFEDRRPVLDKKALVFLGAGLGLILVVSALSLFAPVAFKGKHIEYRLRVQQENPGKALGKMETPLAERKFMEASINDWIMGEYDLRGRTVSPIVGDRGHGYFRLQPHSKIGALWGAQTTDISVSRFLIAEHGSLLAVLLIAVLGLLLFFCVGFVSNRIWSKAIITQVPLLLAVLGLLVWMAVTQRFIFLGQDFPMISITSNLTTFVFIGFLMLLVVAAVTESTLVRNPDEKEFIGRIVKNNRSISVHVLIFSAIIFSLLLVMGNQRRQQFYKPINEKKAKTSTRYDVELSLSALKATLTSFNDDFLEFQTGIANNITRVYPTPYQCLKAFCDNVGYDPEAKELKPEWAPVTRHFGGGDEAYRGFCKMAFDRFLKRGAKKNDVEGLLFIVKKKSRDSGSGLRVAYELKVNDRYYRRELPRTIRDSWKGNIISQPLFGMYDTPVASIAEDDGYLIYTLPEEWLGTKKPVRIVKSLSQNMVIVGKTRPVVLHKGESALMGEFDNMLIGGENIDLSKYGNVSYLAKNVMINGASSFVFPLQEKLFWVRPLSDAIRADKVSNDAKKEATNEDVFLTISTRLTESIYDAVGKVRGDYSSAVAVVDGNGNIISLVDYKNPKYRINPNDSRQIVKKENELRLEGELSWGQEAENYFGNKALTNLRFGPGSSQKPLVWTAVTTQYNDSTFWRNLRLARINNQLMAYSDGGHYSTHYISGQLLSRGTKNRSSGHYSYFQSITGDEGGGAAAVTLSSYIYKSSNYYNAIMSFIGSYSYDDLKMGLTRNSEMSLFKPLKSRILDSNQAVDTLEYRESFPIMQLSGGAPFAFKSIPSLETMLNADNSVLVKGLRENLNLPSVKDRSLRPAIYPFVQEEVRMRSDFAHPQESYFYNKWRQDPSPKARADNAIRYTALGASSVWQVSPLVMAQMYGGLVSMNKNYALSLVPSTQNVKSYERFDIDGVSGNGLGGYAGIRRIFTRGLSQVFYESGGTGVGVFQNVKAEGYTKDAGHGRLTAMGVDNRPKTLYFYGKTGTINGTDETGLAHQDHLLAVVITDQDLEAALSRDMLSTMKFYVIYLADFDTSAWVASDAAVINTVLSSKEFKAYMGIQ